LYCIRKCGCKCSVMSACSRLQPPCNGSTGQVPLTELLKTIAIHRNTHVHLLAIPKLDFRRTRLSGMIKWKNGNGFNDSYCCFRSGRTTKMTFAFIGCYSQDMGHIKGALQENVYIYVEIHFVVSRDIFSGYQERERERERVSPSCVRFWHVC